MNAKPDAPDARSGDGGVDAGNSGGDDTDAGYGGDPGYGGGTPAAPQPVAASLSGGGCQIEAPASPFGSALVALAGALALVARRRRRG